MYNEGTTGRTVDICAWTWNLWCGCTGNTSKQGKMTASSEDFFSEDDFEAVLAILCC